MFTNSDIQIVTAGSILGLKPSGVEKLPQALLSNGLNELSDNPLVDVPTLNHLYSRTRDSSMVLNNAALEKFSLWLSTSIQKVLSHKKFVLVLGGDCSILIGIMSALKSQGTFGLFFFDAHADFYQPEKSITGEAADMELAFITGRGPASLININQSCPYVKDENVVHIGQRDLEETQKYNSQDIRSTAIKCFDYSFLQHHGVPITLNKIEESVKQIKVEGFWIHFDADVIADESNPAVDYRLPGGLSFDQCEVLLKDLIQKYPTIGMSVTILNPDFRSRKKNCQAAKLPNC